MNTEERLEKLEKKLKRVKGRLTAVLVILVILGVLGQAYVTGRLPHKSIRSDEFILEDENGNHRAWLAITKYGPVLFLYDENGNQVWSAP